MNFRKNYWKKILFHCFKILNLLVNNFCSSCFSVFLKASHYPAVDLMFIAAEMHTQALILVVYKNYKLQRGRK